MIKGFKMKLYEGMAEEYEKRHNQLWPEMKDMIHEHGGKNYSIFLDEKTNGLSYAAKYMKGSPYCWQITLSADECERSELAMDAVKRL